MVQALIIVFREGFESFLTVAIIFAWVAVLVAVLARRRYAVAVVVGIAAIHDTVAVAVAVLALIALIRACQTVPVVQRA